MEYRIRKVLSCVVVIVLVFSVITVSASSTAASRDVLLGRIRTVDASFLAGQVITESTLIPIVSPYGETELVLFLSGETEVGYAILVDSLVVEFAESLSPFSSVVLDENESYYYDFATYSKINNMESVSSFSRKSFSEEITTESRGICYNVGAVQLPNFSPQLQNSHNCIVAALANVMWYWGSNGYSSLVYGKTFEQVKDGLDWYFSGVYANAIVPLVADAYAGANGNIDFFGYTDWSPTFGTVYDEINAGRPCMVGYAAGSDYSATVGHMTMCYGYVFTMNLVAYVRLADGHSSSMVTKIWSSYNDCVITLEPSY